MEKTWRVLFRRWYLHQNSSPNPIFKGKIYSLKESSENNELTESATLM